MPLQGGCDTEAKVNLMPRSSHQDTRSGVLNCGPRSVIIYCGSPKRQIMFCHRNFWTADTVVLTNGTASIHLVK